LKVAEDAVRYLLLDYEEDGSFYGRLCETSETTYTARVFSPEAFGHHFYIEEGMISTALHTKDDELRGQINKAIQNRVFGQEGIMPLLKPGATWFPIKDQWDNAKEVGTVQTITYALRRNPDQEQLREFFANALRLICTPTPAKRLGIKYHPAERPMGVYGQCTLKACCLEATGQAVLSLAEYLKPGIIYLAHDKY